MNVAASSFRPDLAKKAYESTFDLERELRATQKKLPPFSPECGHLRDKLRKAYEDVIFLDFNFAHEQDVELSLWMKVHHKTIEAYRSRISKFTVAHGKTKPVELRKLVLQFTTFVKEASKYYRSLILRLVTHFDISELHYLLKLLHLELPSVAEPAKPSYSKELREMVTRSCHVSLIYLGDLSRYRELQASPKKGKKDWGPACGYYQAARRLLPAAGSPMNQLAVVAIYTDNLLGSTYFFLRAACAEIEFPTARDNLTLGYKKILSREKQSEASPVDLFLRLHASLSTMEQYDFFARDLGEVISGVKIAIRERHLSSEALCQMACINIAALVFARKSVKEKEQSRNREQQLQNYLEVNTSVSALLLDMFTTEITSSGRRSNDISAEVSAVLRCILPVLRITSRWIQINMLEARSLWQKYVGAMTKCATRFPPSSSVQLHAPLAEDVELRGFAPLEGGLLGSSLQDIDPSIHPNDEIFIRISTLLADAADLAKRINAQLSTVSTGKPTASPHNGAGLASSRSTYQEKLSDRVAADRLPKQGSTTSHASEPSMAFSLNRMVDSLVDGQADEEIVFRGRKSGNVSNTLSMTPATGSTDANNKWINDSPLPRPVSLWSSSVPAPTPNQGR